ncbi:dTDP-4-dehydrorhamnose 3,5-epimerase [Gammaproteobacteria bacterium]|jgi:dTDP-4-dehydrorhamnose 3,5-epimerase|nr:dTDP-4-dehydrorhamnose 3,5-epimerase [Gammaproteobacteria bacterium]
MAKKLLKEFSGIERLMRKKFSSELGSFSVTFEPELLSNKDFYQDSVSLIEKTGTIKGMHFQRGPYAQTKLVTVLQGSIMDYFVDLRKESPTYLDHGSIELSEQNSSMIFIPEGFAHGYISLEDRSIISYKLGAPYQPKHEVTLLWSDHDIAIKWPQTENLHISEKDTLGLTLQQIKELS